MKSLALLCLILLSPTAHALAPVNTGTPVNGFSDNADMGCIDPAYANQLIKKFGVDVESFPEGKQLCDDTKPSKQMLDSLVMIDKGKIGPTKKKGFDHNFMAPDYVKYFLGHVNTITYDDACGGNLFMACIISQEPTMHVESALFQNETLATQVATLIHEARHVDGYMHVMCESGPNKGINGTCDQSYDEAGSYAVEVEYEARMALDGLNFSPMFKALSRVAAIDRVEQNFVEKPSTGAPYLLLQDKTDGHVVDLAADGKTLVDHAASVLPAGALVIDRSVGANVIPADRSPAPLYLDYYTLAVSKQSDVEGEAGSTARDFAGKWTPTQRADLVSIQNDFSGSGWQVRVFRNSIEATSGTNVVIAGVKPPEAGEPVGTGNALPCYVSGKIQTGFFLRMASNNVYKINFAGNKGPMTFAKQSCTFPADLRQVVKFKTQLLGLDTDGKVWVIGADGKRTAFFGAAFDARRFQSLVSSTRYQELIQ